RTFEVPARARRGRTAGGDSRLLSAADRAGRKAEGPMDPRHCIAELGPARLVRGSGRDLDAGARPEGATYRAGPVLRVRSAGDRCASLVGRYRRARATLGT